MDIVYKKVDELIPYARNNKKHTKEQVEKLGKSIKEFGFKQPLIIDKNNNIVVGHGRLQGAKYAKMKEVPCIVASDLSEDQISALRIADNKLNESKWEKETLKLELEILNNNDFNIEVTGFDLGFLENKEEEITEKEFTQELLESHNYIVMYYDNELDWQVAKEKFGIKTVKGLQSKKDIKKEGIGRIVRGADYL